jgi:tRNA dimethylallyltransferase
VVPKNLIDSAPFFAIVIIGATASGKTAFAHSLFQTLKEHCIDASIVNLDAFQIYKGVSAGTAKPSQSEISQFDYHCLDIAAPNENLDANTFAAHVNDACTRIWQQQRIPICVGGSGLYLRAFLHGLDPLPGRDVEFRNYIRKKAEENSWAWCHELLTRVDPVRAAELHPNDKTRIERALEIHHITGSPMSSLRSKTTTLEEQQLLFPCFIIHMEPSDDILKMRIEKRVPELFRSGWIEEVNALIQVYGLNPLKEFHSMKAIGYHEVINYIQSHQLSDFNKNTVDHPPSELILKISTLTWQYAKKQRTWNNKEKKDLSVTNGENFDFTDVINKILKFSIGKNN